VVSIRDALASVGRALQGHMGEALQYRPDRYATWSPITGRLYVDEAALEHDADRGEQVDVSEAVLHVDADGPVLELGYRLLDGQSREWSVIATRVRHMGGRYTLRRVHPTAAGPDRGRVR
jgi:hypothetical protein